MSNFGIRIFFRYLFMRLLVPFTICVCGCAVIWIMVDMYGHLDDFLENKASLRIILYYYSLQIPNMLVMVLPAAMLFSTLWTLINLNRRCELVAFQSGGMAPVWLFTPFFVFAVMWMLILGYDLSGPAPQAAMASTRVMLQVKGEDAKRNIFTEFLYVDPVNRRSWFFQKLDTRQGKGWGVEINESDADGHDTVEYLARTAEWKGDYWSLGGVVERFYGDEESIQETKTYAELDTDINAPSPELLFLSAAPTEQLTLPQLSEYIAASGAPAHQLAAYRAEWWYRVIYPSSLVVLILYALLQGTHSDRRGAMGGVFMAIIVLLAFISTFYLFKIIGSNNRMPPFLGVAISPFIFGAVGLYLLGRNNGWGWQLLEEWKRWQQWWHENGEDWIK
jgi:lipopolysaccharide export system permease protein